MMFKQPKFYIRQLIQNAGNAGNSRLFFSEFLSPRFYEWIHWHTQNHQPDVAMNFYRGSNQR
jgi:hypothetical protein